MHLVKRMVAMRRFGAVSVCSSVLALTVVPALAGGGPENVLVIIDPAEADARYVGQYYKHARDIPDRNVIFMGPRADDYASHVTDQQAALFGMLANLEIADHIDYIVVPPGSSFFVPASGLVSDGCSAVSRFSVCAVYTMAYLSNDILDGVPVSMTNEYYGTDDIANAFDNSFGWLGGAPQLGDTGTRYFIGALLGYNGDLGNTVEETIEMIDRSVAADGTRPDGTFYYMKTTDPLRSKPRDPFFPAAINSITALGGQALQIEDVLPVGMHDCLGIMTGWASPPIASADMTILPGAFCDHLTSYAGQFDNPSQTKVSEWIKKGASGSHGTVEEPCNYPGKFPHPRMHLYYFKGLSLGEAVFRSLAFVPFQALIYGDPLTRPFAYFPTVSVSDAPQGTVSGTFTLTPTATTQHPTAAIGGFDVYVDGRLIEFVSVGGSATVDTSRWPDGPHDVRVIAYDNSRPKSQGRWKATIATNNHDRSVTLSVAPTSGDLSTPFEFTISAAGSAVSEVRLISSARVFAAAPAAKLVVSLMGNEFGAGPVHFHAEAEFADGRRAVSAEIVLDVSPTAPPDGEPGAAPPLAFSFTKDIPTNEPVLVELPAADLDGSDLSYTLGTLPSQATVAAPGPTVLITPDATAVGCDILTFTVSDGAAQSNVGTVTLRFQQRFGQWDTDGDADMLDFAGLQVCYSGPSPDAQPSAACLSVFDSDCDGDIDLTDYWRFLDVLSGPD